MSEKGKRVACQYVLWCLSERHLTSAFDLFKAVNLCWSSLDFRRRRKLMVYFIRPRYYPTWQGIAGHFNIIKWTQWETDLCASASSQNLQNLSVQWSWSWIKHATGVGALSKTCSEGKLLISSLHSDDMDWHLQFLLINRSTWKKLLKLYMLWNTCIQRTFKVKLSAILYSLKLFSLDLFQHTVKIS